MRALQKLREWFRAKPADVEGLAEGKRLGEGKVTVRVSQLGPPFQGVAPTPNVLDPERASSASGTLRAR